MVVIVPQGIHDALPFSNQIHSQRQTTFKKPDRFLPTGR